MNMHTNTYGESSEHPEMNPNVMNMNINIEISPFGEFSEQPDLNSNVMNMHINVKINTYGQFSEPGMNLNVRNMHIKETSSFGEIAQQPDKDPTTLLRAKETVIAQLKYNQTNRNIIQTLTTEQDFSSVWHHFRKYLLNCSYFGRIVNSKNPSSYKNVLEEMMYKNMEFANSAENRHAKVQKREALNIFKTLFDKKPLKNCGLFIDIDLYFLGATPFMLCGEDHILNIICPLKEFHQNINEAIKNKKIPFWEMKSGKVAINRKCDLYIELQGQMHVAHAQRKYAYVMVWLGDNPSQYKIEEVRKDDQFFENEMKQKLMFFYNEVMLKEVVDSRKARNKALRTYSDETKSFV